MKCSACGNDIEDDDLGDLCFACLDAKIEDEANDYDKEDESEDSE